MKIYIDGSKRAAVSRMFPVWERLGHIVTDNPLGADVQLSVVRISNSHGLPVVLRIDGIYYDAATDYKKRNKSIGLAHSQADAVIYQSNTSRLMCERHLTPRKGLYSVIHNGIDVTNWNSPVKHDGFNVFACSKWRRPKRLEETIEVFSNLLSHVPDAKLHIVGGFKKGGKPIRGNNVISHGTVDHSTMQRLYREGDAYIHMCKKDSCPSSVVEAIASGMPVVTTNACGGATEMCKLVDGCDIVYGEPETLEADYIYQDACNKVPVNVVGELVHRLVDINKSRKRVVLPQELTIDYTAMKYLKVMRKIVGGGK